MNFGFAHLRPLFKLGQPNTWAQPDLADAALAVASADTRALGSLDESDLLASFQTLSQLRPGEVARIVSVQGEPHLALRILELGLVCGTPVRLVRSAPLGGPIEVEVEGFLLSLRRNEADAVRVEM